MALNQSIFEALQPGVTAITQGRNKLRSDLAQGEQEAALRKYLQAQEPEIAGQKQSAQNAENLKTLQSPEMQSQLNQGGSAKAGDLSIGADPYSRVMLQGPHQAQALLKTAQGAYKDINSNLDASKATLDALNLGNASGDKMALINEAKLSLNGGRGVPSIVPMLAGDPTMATDAQKAINWLQNTPNIPTLQPAQRDALRETVFARHEQTKQQSDQVAAQLSQQAPIVAPQTDSSSIVKSFIAPAQQKIAAIDNMQQQYQAQRAKMAPQNPVSQPAQANPNPTTLDRLKSFFNISGQKAPSQTTTAQAQPDDPIAAELAKRAAQSLNKPQQPQAPQGQ